MSEVFICNTTGNDTTGAGTEAQPWATVQKAFDNVLVAGGGGTIRPSNVSAFTLPASPNWTQFNINNTTSADNPLVIAPYDNGGSLAISHPYANYDCFEIDGNDAVATIFSATATPGYVSLVQGKLHSTTGILVDTGNYWGILSCELYDAGASAFIDYSPYGLVAGCYLHTFPAGCEGIRTGSRGMYTGNYIDTPTGRGINCSSGVEGLVSDNIIRNAGNQGIATFGDRNRIIGNTIQGTAANTQAGIYLSAAAEATIAYNNIIVGYSNASGIGIEVASGGNFVMYGHNHFHNNTANESGVVVKGLDLGNNVTTDPGFVDAAGGDFRIGTAGKAKGWPMGFPGSATRNYRDTGAAQRLEQSFQRRSMAGGMG